VALPPSLASQLYQSRGGLPLVLELRSVLQRAGISLPSDDPKYVAWGGSCGGAGAVGIPAGLLGSLGLAEGRPVLVRPLWEVPQAVAVTVEPASEDDWEMVELNAEYLEGQLLTQVGLQGSQR
jgi:peroxin-1